METHTLYLCGQPAVNCLDRHVDTSPEKVALIWERDEPGSEVKVTYRSASWKLCYLLLRVCTVVGFTVHSLQGVTGDDVSPGQPVEAAWSKPGGLCHHLHAPLPNGRGVHAGLCAYWRSTQCCVCRVQCRGPLRANQRR